MRIFVGTTAGTVEILRVAEEDAGVQCCVCIGRTPNEAAISNAYHRFVRKPTGVVERVFGHPSWRLDVSATIDGGESWQLGVFLAHAAAAAGKFEGDERTVVWASGRVMSDLSVEAIDHLADKFRVAESFFAEYPGAIVLVPEANAAEARGLPKRPNGVAAVGDTAAALNAAGLSEASPPRTRWRAAGWAAALLLAVGGAVGAATLIVPSELDPKGAPQATAPPVAASPALLPTEPVTISVMELHPPPGHACPEIALGMTAPLAVAPPGQPAVSRAENLCGLRFVLTNNTAAALTVPATVEADRAVDFHLQPRSAEATLPPGARVERDVVFGRRIRERTRFRLPLSPDTPPPNTLPPVALIHVVEP